MRRTAPVLSLKARSSVTGRPDCQEKSVGRVKTQRSLFWHTRHPSALKVAQPERPDVVPTNRLAADCSRRGGHASSATRRRTRHRQSASAPVALQGPDESTVECWSAWVRLVRALANNALYLGAGISAIMHC